MAITRMTLAQARKKFTPAEKARLDALTDEQINAAARSDPDNPPSTPKELEEMRAIVRSRGRPGMPEEERKVSLTLRLPRDVVQHFRSSGAGWQTRIGETLQHVAHRAAKAKTSQRKSVNGKASSTRGKKTRSHSPQR
jgi:uncharacterized protein (DUF4415 family)